MSNIDIIVDISPVTVEVDQGYTSTRFFNTRTLSTTSTATLTPDIDLYDMFVITAQAEALTIANPTGTKVNGNGFVIRVYGTGSITFGSDYQAIAALPTALTTNKYLYIVCVYNSQADKFDVIQALEQP